MTNPSLLSEREELKRRLSTGEYKMLIDVTLAGPQYLIRKISRNPNSVPFWLSAMVIASGVLFTSFFMSFLLGEFGPASELFPPFFSNATHFFANATHFFAGVLRLDYLSDPAFYSRRSGRIPSEIALVTLTLLGTIILKTHLDATCNIFRNKLVDALERSEDLTDIQRWFSAVCNKRRQLIFGLSAGLLFGIYATVFVSSVRGGFIGVGPVILDVLVNIQVFLGLYYVILFVNLPMRIQSYHFRLFVLNPRRSEVIEQLSRMLFNFVYGIAVFVAVITLILSIFAVMNWVNMLILVLLGWAPIIAAFVLNQYTLSRIIVRAKWRMLNEVQKQIEMLHFKQIIVEKDIMETNRLLDLHDRIWDTPNSVTDISSVIGFINALLLPLITLTLGHLQTILGFF